MRLMDVDELLQMEKSAALDKMQNGAGLDAKIVKHARWTLADNFNNNAVCSNCNKLSHGLGIIAQIAALKWMENKKEILWHCQ